MQTTIEAVREGMDEAQRKAWDALARYKFQMFGYWAAIWVHLNRISGEHRPNPFKVLVGAARLQSHPDKVDLENAVQEGIENWESGQENGNSHWDALAPCIIEKVQEWLQLQEERS